MKKIRVIPVPKFLIKYVFDWEVFILLLFPFSSLSHIEYNEIKTQFYLHFEKSANLKAAQAGLGILIDSHLRCKTSFLLTGCLVFLILR